MQTGSLQMANASTIPDDRYSPNTKTGDLVEAGQSVERPSKKRRVMILGGGFGGTYAAGHLDKTLARRHDVEVVLISRENYLLFTPLLHEVAAGDLFPGDIVNPLRKMLTGVRLIEGDVVHIDLQARTVRYVAGGLRREHELAYDYLLLALGSEPNYFGMKAVEARAATMKTLTDAALLRNRMVALLEEAATEDDEVSRRKFLTFVVAGGGFAGVETVGAMNDFLRETVRYYPELDASMLRLVLVHPGKTVLPELGERLGKYAQEQLRARGVEIRLETRVMGYDGGIVQLAPGDGIGAMTLVWTAGVKPAVVLEALSVEKVKGRVKVNEFLEVAGHEGSVWAAGDCAAVPDGKGGIQPGTAQHGLREALAAARNVKAIATGNSQKPFRYATLGQLASIGHHAGVAQILGMRFSGFLAWWLWRTVYLSKMPGIAKKVRVAIQWSLDLLFSREIEQIVTVRDVEKIEKLGAILRDARDGQGDGRSRT
ncbi:MAG TPA: NAD(P)/FAD-dependent oxidoreductase [Terriglobia bacterium]|nr:NAD(P)/FAD-dependent oxidoreductase [Terriglobia bacterium]